MPMSDNIAELMVDPQPIAIESTSDNDERRKNSRHNCVGTAEILRIQEATGELITARIRNISAGGCYVETQSPLERGSQLAVVLRVNMLRLRVIAEVRFVKIDRELSAGLEFVGMTAPGLQSLQELIAEFKQKT
jgi:PilZ domain